MHSQILYFSAAPQANAENNYRLQLATVDYGPLLVPDLRGILTCWTLLYCVNHSVRLCYTRSRRRLSAVGALFVLQQPRWQYMQQPIKAYHQDEEQHWVAELACGHQQHVRHSPPWVNRPWVMTPAGREAKLGFLLSCKKCDSDAPRDID